MALPLSFRRGIPATETLPLRHAARRTAAVRALLALALSSLLALAFLVARAEDVRHAPIAPAGTTAVVVLDLSASVYESAIGDAIRRMARTGERAGLVVFSDSAYEMLPPRTPATELLPLLRLLQPPADPSATELPVTPWEDFRAGTRISEGLRVAREALAREGVERGSVVLISDLQVVGEEIQSLGAQIGLLRRDGIELRILPLSPTEETRTMIEQLTGPDALLRDPGAGAVRAPEERSAQGAAPWAFVGVAALLVLALAVNERALARLDARPAR